MEKNHYNIKRNIAPLDSQDIQKHQDFDALLDAFQGSQAEKPQPEPKARIRPLWQWAAAAIAAVLAGVVLYNVLLPTNERPLTSSDGYFVTQPYINSPIEAAQPSFASYTVEAETGGTVTRPNGTKVVIPPRAFVNRSGNFAMGAVDIKYREYHDFVDFFLSGIPMEYDSAGVQYILESAGMIEVYAEQDGERLDLAPEKALQIELYAEIDVPDPANPPNYNIYRLDEEARNWVYEGVDDIEVLEKVENAVALLDEDDTPKAALQTELAAIKQRQTRELAAIEASIPQPRKPVRPTKANGNNMSFDLDILASATGGNVSDEHTAINESQAEIAELQQKYEGIVWEVLPNQPQFNEGVAQTLWEKFDLEKTDAQNFQLTLRNADSQVKVRVKPVLMGEDYDHAVATFEAEMEAYNQQMAARETQLQARKQALQEAIALAQETANQQYEERVAAFRKAGKAHKATDEMLRHKILNRFEVRSMGIWNCDRPLPPFVYSLDADFVSAEQKPYRGNVGYIVDKKRNTVRRFYADGKVRVQFDQKTDNLMWLVTNENQLAVYRPEDFKAIDEQLGEHTFVMDLIPQTIESEEDVRAILAF